MVLALLANGGRGSRRGRLGIALMASEGERLMLAPMRTTRTAALFLTAAALSLTALTASPAVAGDDDDDEVQRNGTCSYGTDWKIKAKSDDGRIEVEAEIDSNKVGQTWTWKFKDNGNVFAKGQSTTTAPSGSFEVERKPANLAGTDHFVFRAVHPKSGEVCRATVSW